MADPLPEFPFVFVNGDIPDADHFMDNYEHVRDYLNARIGTLSDKQILVANASGQVVGRLVSGDATLSNTGALTIADNAINAAKLAANAVTNAKLADNAVDTAELADSSVTTPKIGAGVINSSKFFPGAVNTAAIADLAVTGAKIAGGTIGSGKLAMTTVSAQASGTTVLTTSYQDIVTLAAPAAGDYLFFGSATWTPSGGADDAMLRFDDDAGARAEQWTSAATGPGTATIFKTRTLNGSTAVKLQSKVATGSGTVVSASGIETSILGLRIG